MVHRPSLFITALLYYVSLLVVMIIAVDGFLLPEMTPHKNGISKISFGAHSTIPSLLSLSSSKDDTSTTPEQVSSSSLSSFSFAMDPDSDTAHQLLSSLNLSDHQQQQLVAYADLFVEWNDKINLISRKDCSRAVVFGRHILPCLAPLALPGEHRIPAGARVVDVGTGGGLPGIPLAIGHADATFLLVDSVGKKLRAVDDMIERLGLENVQTQHTRAEHVMTQDGKTSACFDWCVGRSVASLPTFGSWMHHLLVPAKGTLLYMIGGDVPEAHLADCDVPIHELLVAASSPQRDDNDEDSEMELLSDKRLLVFSQKSVQDMAKASGNYRTIQQMEKSRNDNLNQNSKSKSKNKNNQTNTTGRPKPKPKGAWDKKRRDNNHQPKQRGYDDFQRYQSQ